MQMKSWGLALAAVTILCMHSCYLDDIFDCERGRGDIVTETLDVTDFDRIRLEIPARVHLTQADFYEVIVEGKRNVIDEIELDVHGSEWDIEYDRCVREIGSLDIYITMPDVQGLIVEGSGQIVSDNTLTSSQLDLLVRGSGMIDVGMDVQYLDARISGSGDLYLEGSTHRNNVRISGSGDLLAFDLITDEADLHLSGSGDAQVTVETYLKVRISGSGDVYYKGDPELDISTSGSGDVFDAN